MMLVLIITILAHPCFVYSTNISALYGNVKIRQGISIPAGVPALEAITLSLNSQNVEPRSVWTVGDVLAVARFKLFTQFNPEQAEMIVYDQTARLRYFNPNNITKIYIHGWSSDESTGLDFRRAYLSSRYPEAVNYIEMLWNDASSSYYGFFRSRVSAIGRALARTLNNLVQNHGLDLAKVHVLGFSAGAHIAGEAGRYLIRGVIGRITGLDPASPLFNEENTSDRLSPDTAMLVDVIHTCSNQLGLARPLGHVDFYPNKGTAVQPGCFILDYLHGMCSHKRAVDLYLESITSNVPFVAFRCNDRRNKAVMGEYLDKKLRGSFCLETGSMPPYALTRSLEANEIMRKK